MNQSEHVSHKGESVKNSSRSKKNNDKRGLKMGQAFILGIIAIVALATVGGYLVAKNGVKNMSENGFVVAIAKTLSLPAAEIEGKKVSYSSFLEDSKTLKKFYTNPPDGFAPATPDDITNQVLSRLLINELVAIYADDLSVSVSDEEVKEVRDGLVSQFPSEAEAEQEMQFRYGWTLDAYTNKIIKPLLVEQKTIEAFALSTDEKWKDYADKQVSARHILVRVESEDEEAAAHESAQAILDRIKGGEDFNVVATAIEETADEKEIVEELGWFGRGVMVPEFEDEAFSMNVGDSSAELVKTAFGFHIIHLDDTREIRDFRTFLDDRLKDVTVTMYINAPNPLEFVPEKVAGTNEETLTQGDN